MAINRNLGDVTVPAVPDEVKERVVTDVTEAGIAAGDAVEPAVGAAADRASEKVVEVTDSTVTSTVNDANKKLADARQGIATTLAPWIPGDFLVIYGTLLTAWTGLRADFYWMIALSVLSAFLFVFLGAIAESGFVKDQGFYWGLLLRAVIGAGACIYACFAVPNSGWYDFGWMRDNETPVVLTAGTCLSAVVLILKTVQKAALK
jgi:hypothetical protein